MRAEATASALRFPVKFLDNLGCQVSGQLPRCNPSRVRVAGSLLCFQNARQSRQDGLWRVLSRSLTTDLRLRWQRGYADDTSERQAHAKSRGVASPRLFVSGQISDFWTNFRLLDFLWTAHVQERRVGGQRFGAKQPPANHSLCHSP